MTISRRRVVRESLVVVDTLNQSYDSQNWEKGICPKIYITYPSTKSILHPALNVSNLITLCERHFSS